MVKLRNEQHHYRINKFRIDTNKSIITDREKVLVIFKKTKRWLVSSDRVPA
jgi:hypothetical protein